MSLNFQQLFVGSDLSHGTWDARRQPAARTEHSPATETDYLAHLSGELGLGLVPVRPDGTCRFGAIDIDLDTIDHATLLQQVVALGLPLYVCRSKSGGAHLYVFLDEPGMLASKLKKLLEDWSRRLGYGGCEVFPKQTKIGKNNFGNWINLPYFESEKTIRWNLGPNGPRSLDEFLAAAEYWNGVEVTRAVVDPPSGHQAAPAPAGENLFKILSQGPPCIERGVDAGIPSGARNSFMFNLAIACRRLQKDGWQDLARQLNQERCTPPLDAPELSQILRSVSGKPTYEFQCREGSISALCNFQECLLRPYGKGYKRETDHDNFDQLQLTHLRKIDTDPPRYLLEVNGQDVELDTDELLTYNRFRRRLMERLDLIVPPQRQDRWELTLQELLRGKEDIAAPEDASKNGLLLDRVRDFLGRYKRAKSLEDVLKDLPFKKDDRVFFRATGLFKHLSQYKLDGDPQKVYSLLHSIGAQHANQRIKGRVTAVWSMPYDELREQTEEFTPVEITTQEEVEM
jgi:hypothetical protein